MTPTDNAPPLALHPLCTLFPRLAGTEFENLKGDIIANGQREPITVHDGLVLDGGNRYRACIEAGIEPLLKPFTGVDPVAFVLSANLHRRHLTPGQQAAIVAQAQDWSVARGVGALAADDKGATLHLSTVADRVAQSGASVRTQKMADKVAKESPELAQKVAHGEISLPRALEQLAPRAPASTAKPAPAVAATPPAVSPVGMHTAAPASAPAVAALVENVDAPDFGAPTVPTPIAVSLDTLADPDDADAPDTVELLIAAEDKIARLEAEAADLRARVAMLEEGDLAAKIVKLEEDVRIAADRASRHYEEFTKANNTAMRRKKRLDDIRRAAGLGPDVDLTEWARQAARRAA